jgi:hypothetical protein
MVFNLCIKVDTDSNLQSLEEYRRLTNPMDALIQQMRFDKTEDTLSIILPAWFVHIESTTQQNILETLIQQVKDRTDPTSSLPERYDTAETMSP